VFESSSPLEGRLGVGGRDGADGARSLRITEVRDWHLTQLGVFGGGASVLAPLVRSITGAALPDSNGEATVSGSHRLYRIALDQYWVISLEEGTGRALEQAVPPDSGTVAALSGARLCLRLEGAAARDVLAHQVALDLDLTEFPAGCFAQTGFDHVGVLLDRRGRERFELYVLSTFAASTWDVLIDAALPYGYDVGVESAASGWSDSRRPQ
jgi:heterotetrameric sarcosine oxidase gamma subunit